MFDNGLHESEGMREEVKEGRRKGRKEKKVWRLPVQIRKDMGSSKQSNVLIYAIFFPSKFHDYSVTVKLSLNNFRTPVRRRQYSQ